MVGGRVCVFECGRVYSLTFSPNVERFLPFVWLTVCVLIETSECTVCVGVSVYMHLQYVHMSVCVVCA